MPDSDPHSVSDSSREEPSSTNGDGVSRRNWISLTTLLIVQAQNAFNDNFVKFVILGLATAAFSTGFIGSNIEHILGAMIPVPFILLAPIAGYFSDRFSKRKVIALCLVGQLAIFAFIAASILSGFILGALSGYFLLAVQSTFFSPAKQGILKELVGSERLGFANGLMQMLTMIGILGGMFLGGMFFNALIQEGGMAADDPWKSALIPTLVAGAAAVIPLILVKWIEVTPSHPKMQFVPSIWVRHFVHLRDLFRDRTLRLTAIAIAGYWFLANFIGLAVIGFGKELYANSGEAGKAASLMLAYIGIGLMIGSLVVSTLSKHRIRLDIVPFGIAGVAIGLLAIGTMTAGELVWNLSLGFIGFSSAFYTVPLNAFLQDSASENSRGRVLSANNLLTSLAGVISIAISLFLANSLGWGVALQVKLYSGIGAIIFLIFLLHILPNLRRKKQAGSVKLRS